MPKKEERNWYTNPEDFIELQERAGRGELAAMRKVALEYVTGSWYGDRPEKARELYLRIAAHPKAQAQERQALAKAGSGELKAILDLAEGYMFGAFRAPDVPKGIVWYKRAVKMKSAKAAYELSNIYSVLTHFPDYCNGETEFKYLKIAADLGHIEAMAEVADKLLRPVVPLHRFMTAMRYASKASKVGNRRAIQVLGQNLIYYKGRYQKDAYRCAVKCAKWGEPWAFRYAFLAYRNGFGVRKNKKMALKFQPRDKEKREQLIKLGIHDSISLKHDGGLRAYMGF